MAEAGALVGPPGSPAAAFALPLLHGEGPQGRECQCSGVITPQCSEAMGLPDSIFQVLINGLYLLSVNTPQMKVVT